MALWLYIYSQPEKGCPPNPTNCQNVCSTSQIVISIILVQILPLALSPPPSLPPSPNFSSLLVVYGSCRLGAWFDGSEPVLGGSLILDQTPCRRSDWEAEICITPTWKE